MQNPIYSATTVEKLKDLQKSIEAVLAMVELGYYSRLDSHKINEYEMEIGNWRITPRDPNAV